MIYLLTQIALCLLAAGLIGALIGWWLRGGCKKKILESERRWSEKYESDRAIWQERVENVKSHMQKSISQNSSEWSTKLNDLELNWESKIQRAVGDSESKNRNLEAEIKSLKDELWLSKSKLESADKEWKLKLDELESKHRDQTASIEVDQKSQEELKNRVKDLESRLKDSELKLKDADQKLQKLKSEHDLKVEALKNECDDKNRAIKSEYELTIKGLKSECDELKNDLKIKNRKLKESEVELIKTDQEIFQLIGNLDDSYDIEEIEGIGAGYGKKIRALGVETTDKFAEKFLNNDSAIKELSDKTKIDSDAIRAWASMADLLKLPGMDGQYAEIVQTVGISSRDELAKSDAKSLYTKMREYNQKHSIVPDTPPLDLILKWIKFAKNKDARVAVELFDSRVNDDQECYDIEEIEGIGPGYGKKLRSLGVETTCDLANRYLNNQDAIDKASKEIKVGKAVIAAWASMADLMRIDGVDGQYAEIMQIVGISSRDELAKSDIDSLYKEMVEFNSNRPIVPEVPTTQMLKRWIKSI